MLSLDRYWQKAVLVPSQQKSGRLRSFITLKITISNTSARTPMDTAASGERGFPAQSGSRNSLCSWHPQCFVLKRPTALRGVPVPTASAHQDLGCPVGWLFVVWAASRLLTLKTKEIWKFCLLANAASCFVQFPGFLVSLKSGAERNFLKFGLKCC